ncbi:MAG: FtsX-like permease family protein [Ignavibacteriae bacterium]|nr:FtsX-like permease family protein [Ignavibacteriota bacterium]
MLIILIAVSGLFGLTLFLTKYRTKEIGVRKVLGASVASIITLFSKEFLWLLFVANVIALPIAYYFMNKWLQNFAYKIDIGILPFLISVVIVIAISLLTIVIQTAKVVIANPVESLKYE